MANKKSVGVGLGVILLKEDKILLGKRNTDPSKADSELHGEGTWTMPGGKLNFGETFEECARREVLEETGIKIKSTKVISLSNDIVEDAHFVTIGLLCEDFEGEPRVMEPDEITEWKWFSIYSPPKPIFPPSEKILKSYLTKKFYLEY
ncbi:MAG: NUDIX domain-containing protein [Candidatus Parvarchaeota archaeon]|nr:NUDIX domain-containing protein [Candidatus Jingweiarchaeum tengchongense]MCW1298274.1 NUDIX domain-containing protein [Candidatus Jingweiarchaeum tengchongense]MCW1300365.1 NUDIX domain-containing protein [Candidatus Jingweiarchaeum tengchongense]MCW1304790.1 NUDIX domain-containing protein [Candidatus Jingweiarchaeum tengchongense]MCW1305380.1 NUDIX domain-containing protein [Candidatus Jingweiarchaeum tengchongense]